MKKLIASLILFWLCSVTVLAQVGAIASRRYGEKNILNYNFGPWKAVSPFNQNPGYTTISDAQILPSNLIQASDTFTSTSNWTQVDHAGLGSCGFSVSSNVGTANCTVAGEDNYFVLNSNYQYVGPAIAIQITINQNGTASSGTYDNFGVGLFKDTNNFLDVTFDHRNNFAVFHTDIAGTNTNSNQACTLPTAPWTAEFRVTNNSATAWVNSGSGWKLCASYTFTTYDLTTDGNLTSWYPGFRVHVAASSSWQFSNFKVGYTGAAALADTHVVTYPDGRPFIDGTKVYFTTSARFGCWELWNYDLSNGALAESSLIMSDRGGHTYCDAAGHLIYDPGNSQYRIIIPGWGSSSSPNIFYGAVSTGTANILGGGVFDVSLPTEVNTVTASPYQGWDPSLVCGTWNYSTSACSLWYLALTQLGSVTFTPDFYSTTSDPSVNSWPTRVGFASTDGYEGSTILRTATTSSTGKGSRLVVAYGGNSKSTSIRGSNVYSSNSFSNLGSINADWPVPGPSSSSNATWPNMFSYGNTEYLLSFDDAYFNKSLGNMGNLVVSTAPKYSTATNWPHYVNGVSIFGGSSSVTSQTTAALTVTAGDLLVGMCRGTGTPGTATITSSPANTFTQMALNTIGGAFDEGFYVFATSSGSTTVTCTLGASSTYVGVSVSQYHAGFLTGVDGTPAYFNTTTAANSFTTGTFSTSAKGLIVFCADGLFGATQFLGGLIGPYSPVGMTGATTGSAACDSTLTDGAQTNITATSVASATTTGSWGSAVMAFK